MRLNRRAGSTQPAPVVSVAEVVRQQPRPSDAIRDCEPEDKDRQSPAVTPTMVPLDFQRLFDALPGCHVLVTADPNPIMVAVNEERCRVTMTRSEDVIGQQLFEVFPDNPDDLEADGVSNLRASLARVVATGKADRMPPQRYDIRRPDGTFEERWWEPLNTPVRGQGDETAYILHTVRDVTPIVLERRSAEAALARSEANMRSVVEGMVEGFLLLDADWCIIDINAEGLRIDGRPREVIVGRHLLKVWPQIAHMPLWLTYQRAMADRSPLTLEHHHVSATRDFWLEVRAHPVADGGLAVFYRDITTRKANAEALRASEERLHALVTASSEVMYSMSPDWSEMRQLSGGGFLADTGTTKGTWLEDYIPTEDQPQVVRAIQDAVRERVTFELEHRVRRADGSIGWTASRAVPLMDASGAVRGWFGAASDVTARKEAETALRRVNETLEIRVAERTAELRQAADALRTEALERKLVEERLRQMQKMEAIGQLTGGIAHDFNNMLQAIGGSLEIAQRRIADGRPADAGRFTELAHRTVDSAAALTHRLLAFARRQVLQPKVVEPDELVVGIAELIRRTVGSAIQVDLHLANGVWSVMCDPNQLESALLNLAINARDAMPTGGRITIGTEEVNLSADDIGGLEDILPGEFVQIAVADTGSGMDDGTRMRAFEPFFTTKPMGQGTGLGLSQVYGFVRQSGGCIWLDSDPGLGTTARLYLPRHGRAVTVERDKSKDIARVLQAHGDATVLLVEDEEDVRMVAAAHLNELGYRVLEAGDGRAALQVLREAEHVDLLVSDVGLPGGLNGRQLAEMAREHRPRLPVLLITGFAGTALEERIAPGMAILHKPFALDTLASEIQAMVAARRAAQ